MDKQKRLVGAALLWCTLAGACSLNSDDPPPDAQNGGGTVVELVDAFPNLQFDDPIYLTMPPGDNTRVFVVERGGVIKVFANQPDASGSRVFLNLSSRITQQGEQGLLGMAFDPQYVSNGRFYLNYNPNSGTRRTVIARYQVSANDADVADAASETVLLSYDQPETNHKGGWLGFGPDGKLYIATGDGGGAGDPDNNAQNLGSLLGKFLRIETDGSAVADNPFVAQQDARGEIWAYGLRNPFRASFDRGTGELWAADVGQNRIEEIDLITRGGNYGWRKFEGNTVFNATDPDPGNAIAPVFQYEQNAERCSIIGGYVYRGAALGDFAGTYVYADFCSRELWGLRRDGGTVSNELLGTVPGDPVSFGEDSAGELYITAFDGHIYKLAPPANQ